MPDILVFGKKTPLSGIMVNKKFSNIFKSPIRLEVTWDADLIDMVRARYVIEAYKKFNILQNVYDRSIQLLDGLKSINEFKNIRNSGLLFGFDFNNKKIRDNFVDELFKNKMIVNPTKDLSIRLRPPLSVNSIEIDNAIKIFEHTITKCF